METEKDKQLEKFTKKLLSEVKQEEVPFNFTSKVMLQIEKDPSEVLVYKPLIPKSVWVFGLFLLVLWLGYLFINHFEVSSGWVPRVDFSSLFNGFRLSKSASYTILLFAIMVCVQVSFLKRYFDKRLLSK
ncbi:MAG: hypothetical protein ACON5F_08420 [Jejuia sp.]